MILEGGGGANLGTYKYMYRQKGESRGSRGSSYIVGQKGGGPDPRTPPPRSAPD